MRNELILRSQDGDGGYVVVETSPFTVGRAPENDLRIRHPGVSGFHAEIHEADDIWRVTDRGSTNGTFVNGVRIESTVVLRVGDILHFGGVGFRVVREIDMVSESPATRTLPDSSGRVRSVIELFRIIQEGRSWPAFQPILDLGAREVMGWEALGRAASRNAGGPAVLFKIAEESNAASGLSASFRQSARQCASCRHCWPAGTRKYLFLNLHPAEILVPSFPELLDGLVDSALLRWYQPVVELPESLVINGRELVVWVEEIRRRGLLVAYDDFGKGQSRIPDLLHAPPDFLKLDRELVSGLGSQSVKDDLVKAIVDACGRLGVHAIAEGIETEEELAASVNLGIEYGQGYLLAKPTPAWKLFGADPDSLPEDCLFVRHGMLPDNSMKTMRMTVAD